MIQLIRIAFATLIITSPLKSVCQDFVIDTRGDTLQGKVKIITNGLDNRVQIQGRDKEKKTLTILQVKSIRLQQEMYEPIKNANNYVFMKVVKKGYLSLYAFQLEKQMTYDGLYLLKLDGRGLEVPNIGFKRIMNNYVAECPDVALAITSGSLGRNQLNEIIDAFNVCIARNTAYLIKNSSVVQATASQQQWIELEKQLLSSTITDKQDALEMIKDVRSKLNRGEKLPKFLVDGLKSILEENTQLSSLLEKALAEGK
jgi:hypothetical protein